jgi:8-oxo-dGTP diphosphatase
MGEINLIKTYVPFEGEIHEYKDGKYRFTSGHWQKLDKKLEEKIVEANQLYYKIYSKYKDLDFFTYLKLRKFTDETIDLLLAEYFKDKNKRFTYTKNLNRKFLVNFASKLEECIQSLPKEHLFENPFIKSFDIRLDAKDGYAFYLSSSKRIIFSKTYISGVSSEQISDSKLEPDKIVDVEDSHELKATLIHEIGHGVWEYYLKKKKIKEQKHDWIEEIRDEEAEDITYVSRTSKIKTNENIEKLKDFSELCGYGRYNPFLYDTYPSGRAKKILRTGVDFKLITDYAELNPQEAFSEYYSFYALYSNVIKEIINNKNIDEVPKNHLKYRFTNVSYKRIYENKAIFRFLEENMFEEGEQKEIKKALDEVQRVLKKPHTEYADMILVNDTNKFLLLKRTKEEEIFPGLWGLPGGHMEPAETPKEASIRECEEETSIKVKNCSLFHIKEIENGTIHYFISKFGDYDNSSLFLIEKEHSNYYWCDKIKLEKLDLIPGLKEVLKTIFS